MYDRLNATKILMTLLWNENEVEYDYLKQLLKLFIALLRGGNKQVQKTIYDCARSNTECEKLFFKLNTVLLMNPAGNKEDAKV